MVDRNRRTDRSDSRGRSILKETKYSWDRPESRESNYRASSRNQRNKRRSPDENQDSSSRRRNRSSRTNEKRRSDSKISDDSSDDDYRRDSEFSLEEVIGTESRKSRFTFKNTKVVNVLFVGCSGSGKSSFINQLLDPMSTVRSTTGFSETRKPEFHSCTLMYEEQPYHFNLIDTPGFNEYFKDVSHEKNRNNEILINVIMECLQNNVTFLNAVMFVSIAGTTQRNDLDVFEELIDALGETVSSNAFLLLTHAELLPASRKEEFKKDLREAKECKKVVNYCKKGVLFSGAVNRDHIINTKRGIRKEFALNLVKKARKLRDNVVEQLITTVNEPKRVRELDAMYDVSKKALDETVRKGQCVIL